MAIFQWPSQHEPNSIFVLVAATALLSYLAYSQFCLERTRRAFKLQHGCQPVTAKQSGRGPFGFRDMYQLITAKKEHRLLDFYHQRHAEIGSTYVTGSRNKLLVYTNDPDNIKCALATRFEDWGIQKLRQDVVLSFLGKGIFTTDGAFWQHSRTILRPQFEKSQISALDQFEPYVQKLITCIPADGSTVDLQHLFHKLSMDTSTDFILESGTDYLGGDKNAEMIDDSINKCLEDGVWREMLGPFYYLLPNTEARKALNYAHAAVDGWVKQAMEHKDSADLTGKAKASGKRYVFINELARHKEVDATRVRDEALNILLAGKDTTASLLSSLWFSLAREPEVYKKLQAEVAELNGERPSYESLRNMKYIKYTVQEALRLYPPSPMLGKLALKDTVLPHGGGSDGLQPLFVPKGSKIIYNTYSTMRQRSIYGPDADAFRPERWADPSLRPGWGYLPFGGGSRVCLGQQYALTETYYVTIRMLQRFGTLECRDELPWMENVAITCCSLNGTKVSLRE